MQRKLFSASSSRRSPRSSSFRPRLEPLEERLAPYVAMVGQNITLNGLSSSRILAPVDPATNQQDLMSSGLAPSSYGLYATGGAPVDGFILPPNQPVSDTTGGAASAGTPSGPAVGGSNGGKGSSGFSMAQVEQLVATLYQMAATQNPQAANALVLDAVFKAVDTYFDDLGKSVGIHDPKLEGQISAYQNAINQNPLEQSPVGQLLGTLVSNLTLNAVTNGHPSGF